MFTEDTIERFRSHDTPFYHYDLALLRATLSACTTAAVSYGFHVHYALKANSSLGIVRLVRDAGADADANSIGEIEVAMRVGFRPDQIVFTGVGKSPDELSRAVGLEVKAINAESAGELDRSRLIQKHAAGDDYRVLREEAWQLFGVFSEEDLPIAAFGDVAQQIGVDIRRFAQSDDADRDARLLALL